MTARFAIGLTGDVGSGKSTVREWLAGRGAATLDADAEVRALLARDSRVIDEVATRFGPTVVVGGAVDRAALARIVFADPEALADLERIVHPAVTAATRAWLADVAAELAVIEAVKLVEAGMHRTLDVVWLVVCEADVRRRRLIARGWSPEEAARRMAAATPLAPRLAAAGVVIDNSGPPAATVRQLEVAFGQLGRLRLQRPTGGRGAATM